MAWIKIDDQMVDHPKIVPLSDRAFRWLHKALSYANRFPADGVLPPAFLDQVPTAVRTELENRGVWERIAGTTRIYHYLKYQPSKAKIARERNATKRRQEKFRRAKVTGKTTRESRVSNGVTNGASNAVTNGAPARPGPASTKRSPPSPPNGGAPVSTRKPTQAEERWATEQRRQLGCPHDDRCQNAAQCTGKLVMDRRRKVHHGMQEASR